MSLDDKEAIILIKDGKIDNFKSIVDKYTNKIFYFLKTKTPCREDAEDLTQISFINFYRKIENFDQNKPVYPYLVQIAKNELKMFYRQRKKTVPLIEEIAYQEVETPQINQEIEILNKIPKKQAEILQLLSEGFSYREISEKLGKPINTVRTLIRRSRLAVNKLRK